MGNNGSVAYQDASEGKQYSCIVALRMSCRTTLLHQSGDSLSMMQPGIRRSRTRKQLFPSPPKLKSAMLGQAFVVRAMKEAGHVCFFVAMAPLLTSIFPFE